MTHRNALLLVGAMCGCASAFVLAGTPLTYTAAFDDAASSESPLIVQAEGAPDTIAETAEYDSPLEAEPLPDDAVPVLQSHVPNVPFYSQFDDISDPSWKKIGCGIASLAMIIDYYGATVPVDTLLEEGVAEDAYLTDAGWTYAGLIRVAESHELTGKSIVMHDSSMTDAYAAFEKSLQEGPAMASVYYTFTPGHPIPHLVVVNGIKDDMVYYNDPAESDGNGTISVEKFKAAWKKRFIEFRPSS